MKKFRKIMAVLVAVMMIMATMVPAWADVVSDYSIRFDSTTKGSIAVANSVTGETYNIYKIFDLASFVDTIDPNAPDTSHTDDRYAYVLAAKNDSGTADNPWVSFFTTGAGASYIKVSNTAVTIGEKQYYPVTGIKTTSGTGADEGLFAEEQTENGNDPEKDFDLDALYSHSSQAFARAAVDFISDWNGIAANSTNQIAVAQAAKPGNGGEIKFQNLSLGYYLVTSSLGTLVAVDTTNLNPTVHDKNVAPTSWKHVQEDSKSFDTDATTKGKGVVGYVSKNDADMGDTIYYRNVVKIGKGAKSYVIHDTMEDGLTPDYGVDDANVKVYLVKGYDITLDTPADPTTGSLVPASGAVAEKANVNAAINVSTSIGNYKLLKSSASLAADKPTDTCTFEIVFTQEFLDEVDKQIAGDAAADQYSFVVLYQATLNKNAKVGEPGNKNTFKLTYGADQTQTVTTTTYTWGLDLLKYWDSTGAGAETGLANAQFQIRRGNNSSTGTLLRFVEDSVGTYRYEAAVQNDTLSQTESISGNTASENRKYFEHTSIGRVVETIKSDANGIIKIYGLDGSDYVVTETLAPRGFNKLADDIQIHLVGITEDEKYNVEGESTNYLTAGEVLLKHQNDPSATSGAKAAATTIAETTQDENNAIQRMIKVENFTTAELPSTGGMGTTVLYIVGGMLVILAGAYLFFSRKRTA